MLKVSVVLLLIAACHALPEVTGSQILLRGVTVFKAPFVEKDNVTGKFQGFIVDLLDEMSRKGKFNYTLDNVRVPQNSMLQDNYLSLLISDVLSDKADFALSDSLFKTDNYVRYVNFTQPYITSGFSALVQKSLLKRDNITNFVELMNKTTPKAHSVADVFRMRPHLFESLNHIETVEKESVKNRPTSDILIGVAYSSATNRQLTMAGDSMGRQVYERLVQKQEGLVDSVEIGVRRAAMQPFAFIQESFQNELEVDKNCNLTHLPMKPSRPEVEAMSDLEYSIAVRKRYVHLELLNNALKQVKESGKLEEIRRKYFNWKCNSNEPEVRTTSSMRPNSSFFFAPNYLIVILFCLIYKFMIY